MKLFIGYLRTSTNRQFCKRTIYVYFSVHQIGVTSVQVFLGIGLLLNTINDKSMTSKSLQGFDGSQVVLVLFKRSKAVMTCGPYSEPFCNFIEIRQGFKKSALEISSPSRNSGPYSLKSEREKSCITSFLNSKLQELLSSCQNLS